VCVQDVGRPLPRPQPLFLPSFLSFKREREREKERWEVSDRIGLLSDDRKGYLVHQSLALGKEVPPDPQVQLYGCRSSDSDRWKTPSDVSEDPPKPQGRRGATSHAVGGPRASLPWGVHLPKGRQLLVVDTRRRMWSLPGKRRPLSTRGRHSSKAQRERERKVAARAGRKGKERIPPVRTVASVRANDH
jgi:hypothetical protein